MHENENKKDEVVEEANAPLVLVEAGDEELGALIDQSLLSMPLEKAQQQVIQRILEADTKDELKKQFELFNITQGKKNALRIIKLNSLLDDVEDQAIERFNKKPDQVSNKELLDYMQVVSAQIERSQKYIDILEEKPMVQINKQKNELNISNITIGPQLDRESKNRVKTAVAALLKEINKKTAPERVEALVINPEDSSADVELLEPSPSDISNPEDED